MAAVASGLAARAHEVHVATGRGEGPWPAGEAHWHEIVTPWDRPQWRLLTARAVGRLARTVRPDVVIERYHNFGGEGILAARACSVPAVLEVNAPVVDYAGSPKRTLDRLALVEPMRRWRDWQCRQAALVVTPTRSVLPSWIRARAHPRARMGRGCLPVPPRRPGPDALRPVRRRDRRGLRWRVPRLARRARARRSVENVGLARRSPVPRRVHR